MTTTARARYEGHRFPADFVKVERAACLNVALLTPEALLLARADP